MARRVPGEGAAPARVLLLGEYPGVEETQWGRPFVGKAGKELRRYLNGYDLPQPRDVYITNLRKTMPDRHEPWTVSSEDAEAFADELRRVRPETIVTLGAHVTRYCLGDADVTLDPIHGIPHGALLEAYGWAGVCFPTYNPAATLRNPTLQSVFAYDMRRLSAHLKGTLPLHTVDTLPRTYTRWAQPCLLPPLIAADTEGLPFRPWGASWSGQPGYGFVAKLEEFGFFADAVRKYRPRLVLHNALHDLAVLRDMGLDLDEAGLDYDDTMVMAYLLGLEPQGLKPLGYRHAGALHDDYSDIVAEPSERHALEWVAALAGDPRVPVKLQNLMMRMLTKDGATLRTRWGACRSREVLVDELQLLQEWEADPPEASLDDVPEAVAVNYAGRDADLTLRVYRSLRPQVTAMGLDEVYETDLGIVPMIDRMQAVGLDADLPHYANLAAALRVELGLNRQALADMGFPINPNSGDQVAEALFDILELQTSHPNLRIKRTASGKRFTTNDKILEALETAHPVVPLIQDGREITKMLGTYAEAIPRLVGRDGRLHPRFRLTRTDTGRLSAADPNVLALPKHSARGKLVRMGLKAGPGRVLSEWDLTQIEMVVFACDAMDRVMLDAIRSGVDFHRQTAARLFGKPLSAIDRDGEERFAAKAVNFGILMGITAYGLLDQFHKNGQLQWTLAMCDELLLQWHATYVEGSAYISRKHAEARQYGYVRDRWGRLRWLEGIHSYDKYIAAEAERMAQATPTQSGAQGIIKRAMRALWPVLVEMRKQGVWVECLLQVHDALVFEHALEDAPLLDAVVMQALTETVTLPVPIKAKAKIGVQRLGEL